MIKLTGISSELDNLDFFGDGNILFLFPHPDDELSSTALISKLIKNNKKVFLIYLSSGVPSEEEYQSPLKDKYPFSLYSVLRGTEFYRALKLLSIPSEYLSLLNYSTKKTPFYINSIYSTVEKMILREKVNTLLSCAYEGGHPDHDICSFVASSIQKRHKKILGVEYTSYFMENGKIITGKFMHSQIEEKLTITLSKNDKRLKKNMHQLYSSQSDMLKNFLLLNETFRIKPYYNYSSLPARDICYESWQGSITAEQVLQQIKISNLL